MLDHLHSYVLELNFSWPSAYDPKDSYPKGPNENGACKVLGSGTIR